MTRVVHPTLPGVERNVSDPERWQASGWLIAPGSEPEPDREESDAEPDLHDS